MKPIALDVTNDEQIAAAAKQCQDVQIVINNAGISLNQGIISAIDTSILQKGSGIAKLSPGAMTKKPRITISNLLCRPSFSKSDNQSQKSSQEDRKCCHTGNFLIA